MAGAPLADDVALQATVISGLFRVLAGDAPARFGARSDLSEPAAAAGVSVEAARQWLAGSLVLPPHQSMVLAGAIIEKERLFQVATAEYRVSQAPAPVTGQTLRDAVEELRKAHPAWSIDMPDGWERLNDENPGRLIWQASTTADQLAARYQHSGGWDDVRGASPAELDGKLRRIEEHLDRGRKQLEAYHGHGLAAR